MKKYLLIALASLFAFASCSKESNETPEVKDENTVNLTFTSKRPQLKSESKTAWDGNTIVWSEGDKIRVGCTIDDEWLGAHHEGQTHEPTFGNAKFYSSDVVTINESDKTIGTFKVPISNSNFVDPETSGQYQFFSIYPSNILTTATVNNPEVQSITLPATQHIVNGTFDSSADIMLGQSSSLSLSGLPTDPISLSWTRLVAHADLTFSNLAFEGTENVSKVTLTFNEEAKVAGSFSVNFVDGTAGAGNSNVLTLSSDEGIASSSSSFEAWACVLPVTFTSLDVEIKTDKATYTRSISGISKTFKQNSRNTLTINMSTATRTAEAQYEWVEKDLSEITSSDVFVIVGNNGNNYALSNENGTSSAPSAVHVTVSDNKLSAAPSETIQWTLSVSGDNYTFFPVGSTETWLYCTNTNNGVRVGTSDNKVFTLDSDSGYLKNAATSRYLGVYNSADWRCYTESTATNIKNQVFAFYVKSTPDSRADAELSFAETSFNVNVGDDFTAPTLTNPHNVAVTYSSSNENLAVVDENTGEVVIGDEIGTVTIAASFAGDATYKPASATYTITILNSGNDGSLEKPYTASEARELALSGDEGSYYIRGIVTKIQNQYNASYGTANFWIDENGTSQDVFEGYKIKYFDDKNWVDGNKEIAVGDQVIIYGTLTKYNSSSGTIPETSSGYLVLLNGKTRGLTLSALAATPDNNNKQITVTWGAATGGEKAVSYVVSCGTQTYNASAAGSHTFTMADYGTYTVSVEASAEDAVSAKPSTTVTLSDPGSTAPDPETITFADLGLENGVQYSEPFDGGNFTITFAGGDNDGKYYTTGAGIRTYGGGSITVSSTCDNNISSIEFTWSSSSNAAASNVVAGYTLNNSTGVWSGDAKTVTLTRPSGSGHWRLQSVTVTYK